MKLPFENIKKYFTQTSQKKRSQDLQEKLYPAIDESVIDHNIVILSTFVKPTHLLLEPDFNFEESPLIFSFVGEDKFAFSRYSLDERTMYGSGINITHFATIQGNEGMKFHRTTVDFSSKTDSEAVIAYANRDAQNIADKLGINLEVRTRQYQE